MPCVSNRGQGRFHQMLSLQEELSVSGPDLSVDPRGVTSPPSPPLQGQPSPLGPGNVYSPPCRTTRDVPPLPPKIVSWQSYRQTLLKVATVPSRQRDGGHPRAVKKLSSCPFCGCSCQQVHDRLGNRESAQTVLWPNQPPRLRSSNQRVLCHLRPPTPEGLTSRRHLHKWSEPVSSPPDPPQGSSGGYRAPYWVGT